MLYCLATLLFLVPTQDPSPEQIESVLEQLRSKEVRWREDAIRDIRTMAAKASARNLLRKELDKAAKGDVEPIRTHAIDLLRRLEVIDKIPKRLGQIKGFAELLFDDLIEDRKSVV